MNKMNQSGFSIIKTLLIIIVGFFIWNFVSNKFLYKDSPKYLVDLKKAIQNFSDQKETVKDAYNEAIAAQDEAEEVKYVFSNEKTQAFINKWKQAEKEVGALRASYARYKDKTENFIDGLDDKLGEIKNDASLKKRMKEYSKEKARAMADNIKKMDTSIERLEKSIERGNNLIIALETVSSFNELAQDVEEFDMLLQDSGQIFTDMDSLIAEGITVLDEELSA